MWICNPLRNEGSFRTLFSTHPSTESRIERLEALARKMKANEIPEYEPDEDSSRSKMNFQ